MYVDWKTGEEQSMIFVCLMTRLRVYAVLLVLYIASVSGSYFYGRITGNKSAQAKTLVVYKKEITKNEGIDRQINRMVDSDLDNSLLNWVR